MHEPAIMLIMIVWDSVGKKYGRFKTVLEKKNSSEVNNIRQMAKYGKGYLA